MRHQGNADQLSELCTLSFDQEVGLGDSCGCANILGPPVAENKNGCSKTLGDPTVV